MKQQENPADFSSVHKVQAFFAQICCHFTPCISRLSKGRTYTSKCLKPIINYCQRTSTYFVYFLKWGNATLSCGIFEHRILLLYELSSSPVPSFTYSVRKKIVHFNFNFAFWQQHCTSSAAQMLMTKNVDAKKGARLRK